MSIRVECSCGKSMQADNVFAGGQVKCVCGAMVPVPAVDPKYVDKIRFNCPHCNMRVLGKRASVGKKSKCPGCGKAYVIPEPDANPAATSTASPAGFGERERIRIDANDIAFLTDLMPGLIDEQKIDDDKSLTGETAIPLAADATPDTSQDSGISDAPPPAATPVPLHEIRIDLTGGRGTETPPKIDSPKSTPRPIQAEEDFIPLAELPSMRESKSEPREERSSVRDTAFFELLQDLERKTELPIDDDTIPAPSRPVPSAISKPAPGEPMKPLPLKPVANVPSEQPVPFFTDDPVPNPTIPLDELRLVDSLVDSIAPTEARPTTPSSGPKTPERVFLSQPDMPRPVPKRQLSAPPVGGVSIYSPVVRPIAQAGGPASLVFEDGESAGQMIPLRVRNFLIGRERDCHFRPKSASVSHHHCVLKTDSFSVRIRDLGSRNGTYVNGHRIQNEVLLHHSDSVWIGDVRFKVDIPHDLYAGYQAAEAQLSMDEFRIF